MMMRLQKPSHSLLVSIRCYLYAFRRPITSWLARVCVCVANKIFSTLHRAAAWINVKDENWNLKYVPIVVVVVVYSHWLTMSFHRTLWSGQILLGTAWVCVISINIHFEQTMQRKQSNWWPSRPTLKPIKSEDYWFAYGFPVEWDSNRAVARSNEMSLDQVKRSTILCRTLLIGGIINSQWLSVTFDDWFVISVHCLQHC